MGWETTKTFGTGSYFIRVSFFKVPSSITLGVMSQEKGRTKCPVTWEETTGVIQMRDLVISPSDTVDGKKGAEILKKCTEEKSKSW